MPCGFQEVESPRFQDNRHIDVVRLLALHTGRLYRPRNIPGADLCYRLSQLQAHSAAGRIMSMTPLGNETATFWLAAQCLNQLCHRVPHIYTVELQLSGLAVTTCHPDTQKIRITVFLFDNRLHWQFDVQKVSINSCFRLHIYLCKINY